jgi:glycosyltransferase involved in cell wall biosynthesis
MGMRHRPVRVLHIIDTLGGGGAERQVADIVRLSAPADSTHFVVTILPDCADTFVYAQELQARRAYERSAPTVGSQLIAKWVTVARRNKAAFPAALWRVLSLLWHAAVTPFAIRRIAQVFAHFRPDVIHTHLVPDSLILGVLVRMVAHTPVIHTVPCLFSQMADDGIGWVPHAYRLLHPWIDRFSTGAVSELLGVGIPAEKILYELGGVDLELVEPARSTREEARLDLGRVLGLAADCPIALAVGRLHPSKGHAFAIEALFHLPARLSRLHLVILGEGDERDRLRALAARASVGDRVHLLGFRSDPLPFYAAADVYLRTTLLEPENLSFYLASAMGLPIVGFEIGWQTDPLRSRRHGVVVPARDSVRLAEAIAAILASGDRGRDMGEAGITYAREQLDLRESVAKLSAEYRALCPQPHIAAR